MDRTLRKMIQNIVFEELRYYRHYDGIVVDNQDPLTKGRVRVTITELGQFKNDQGVWARPRQLHALDVPIVGEIVEVYFINGDRTRAVYLANSAENKGQIPAAYTDPSKHVLHQDPTTADTAIYDDKAGTLDVLLTGAFGMKAKGKDLKTILDNILSHILSLDTAGSATAQVLGPTSTSNFTNDKADVDVFFKVES